MNRQELLEVFAGMSEEDRAVIRAEVIRSGAFESAPGLPSAMAATIELMDRIRHGENPMAACHEMLDEMAGMCCD